MDKYAEALGPTVSLLCMCVCVCEGENEHTLVAQAAVLVVITKRSRREGGKRGTSLHGY